jgi:hypothetical protein
VENIAEMMHNARLPSEKADGVLWYHKAIVNQLIGIASIAFKEREIAVSRRILDELHEMGMRYAESGSLQAAGIVIEGYALIVRNNLVGQQLMNMIELAVDQIYSITCHVVKNRVFCQETAKFVLQSFRSLGDIGKLVIKNESYGHNFVAKHIISHTFGELLSTLIGSQGRERLEVIQELLYEYMKLGKRLILKSEIIDIVLITTWLRKEMIPHQHNTRRVYPYLYLFMLLTAAAMYLRRHDVVMLFVRAVGKYFAPNEQLLVELNQNRIQIRRFFDYHEPERYLTMSFALWKAYHTYSRTYPLGPEQPIHMTESIENQEVWRDLFDGLDPNEFLQPELQ